MSFVPTSLHTVVPPPLLWIYGLRSLKVIGTEFCRRHSSTRAFDGLHVHPILPHLVFFESCHHASMSVILFALRLPPPLREKARKLYLNKMFPQVTSHPFLLFCGWGKNLSLNKFSFLFLLGEAKLNSLHRRNLPASIIQSHAALLGFWRVTTWRLLAWQTLVGCLMDACGLGYNAWLDSNNPFP